MFSTPEAETVAGLGSDCTEERAGNTAAGNTRGQEILPLVNTRGQEILPLVILEGRKYCRW